METEATLQLLGTIITAIAGVVGAYFAVRKTSQEQEIRNAQREQRQSDRLDRIDEKISNLEKKVDIHNGYAEKFGDIANSMTAMSKDIEYLKNRSK